MATSTSYRSNWIDTSDLHYIHPAGKYSFSFLYWGDGVFFLKSRGFLDENSFNQQFSSGDIARERLRNELPETKYHLVWDISEISGVSLFARRHILKRIRNNNNFGSVSIVGGNLFAQTYIKLVRKTVGQIKFLFFRTIDEAKASLENSFQKVLIKDNNQNLFIGSTSEAYALFIDMWQKDKQTIVIGDQQLKYILKPQWTYKSSDNSFSFEIMVIEGNIIYYKLEGFARPVHVDNIYAILESIIRELHFNTKDNKFYSILNIRKLRGITLSSRKRTSHYEFIYHKYAYCVLVVPSGIMNIFYKIIKKVSPENFKHWEKVSSIQDALNKILLYQSGKFQINQYKELEFEISPLAIPKTKQEMVELIKNQHNEIQLIKHSQQEHIPKIISFMGNMTWDESYIPPVMEIENAGPFLAIYNTLTILFNDFKEIIEETNLKAQQLQESEDKYRNLINLANDVIAVYQDEKLKFVNSRVTQALGYSIEEVKDKPMYEYVAPEEVAKLQEYYGKRINEEDAPRVYESIFIHKDGHQVPVSMSVGKVIYEGRPASMIIARDITLKKRTDEELEKYRNHLEEIVRKRTEQLQKEVTDRRVAEESDRLKTAFLSNMSHEIRTPMNAIISFSNYLKDPELPQTQREEYLNFIQSSGQSLLNLINDIIDISKIEAKQLSIQLSSCKVEPLLHELYQLFEQTRKNIQKDNVVLQLNCPTTSLAALQTDPYRLKQIISNLLDNALKFTDTGFIEFGYTLSGKFIIFYVKDTGIGIPAEKMDMVFKRFGRLNTSERNISGTGLGLALSKNLANLLNGDLWVESEEREGTTFYLKLPNTESSDFHEEKKTIITEQKSVYNWKGKRILVAEDEDLNFKVLQIALSRTGAELIRAHNGREALSYVVNDNTIDIVLMDIQMPEMDGYEAMSLIKKYSEKTPIIAQTAFALLEERKKCIELGFDDYISKPISIADLYYKIDLFLKSKSS